jgi:1,4-alpha-glucan branching enzyme
MHALAPQECVRAALAIVLLAPSPPLIFMGEEFAAATPFLFFCDFEPKLAAAVTQGRREEFRSFAAFADADAAEQIPDPSAPSTFARSKLDWRSVGAPPHDGWLSLYRELLHLRQHAIVPLMQKIALKHRHWRAMGDAWLNVVWPLDDGRGLRLDANLGDRTAPQPHAATSEIVYATPGAISESGALQPWSVVWHIREAERGAAR